MAIFGKRKDKAQQGDANGSGTGAGGATTGSPTADGQTRSPTQGSKDGHSAPHEGSVNGSISGMASMGAAGSGFGPPGAGSVNGTLRGGVPPGVLGSGMVPMGGPATAAGPGTPTGPPGAASGFKFGGPAARPDVGPSGIPQPGAGQANPQQRMRKPSQDGYGPAAQGVSGLPPQSGPSVGPPLSNSAPGATERPRTQQIVYPWSQRSLTMNPPRFLDETRQAPPGALSPSPFPRYGHAANSVASASGEVYLFGGLVRESVKNDLYTVHLDKPPQPSAVQPGAPPSSVLSGGGLNATLVQTTGDIPPPRVGHATLLVSNVLILWGGDTKVRADDRQDEGLYLLNLSTREWTRVRHSSDAPGAGPVGRYGHTVSIVGSRFYVFGGQVDGTFMNDMWSFDLNSLKDTPRWDVVRPANEAPPRRTGHASVTFKDKIYIFGGTDGQYHYNDTWCYDVSTNSWRELSCIGYIPVPREGHAACLVDDVMYIFGGRGVDGKDLGDLASFRISNQRWYMFANMGPAPSGRSGHVLTTFQNKVVVLGGESFTGGKPDDPATVYVLDTGKIKYPPDTNSKLPSQTGGPPATVQPASSVRKAGSDASRTVSPSMDDPRRAASPTARQGANGIVSVLQTTQQQQPSQPQQQPGQMPMHAVSDASRGPAGGATDGPSRSMSPTSVAPGPSAPRAAMMQPSQSRNNSPATSAPGQAPPPHAAAVSGTGVAAAPPGHMPTPYGGPRSQRSLENMRTQAASPSAMPGSLPKAINGSLEQRGVAPADGFHYGHGNSPPQQLPPQQQQQVAPQQQQQQQQPMLAQQAPTQQAPPHQVSQALPPQAQPSYSTQAHQAPRQANGYSAGPGGGGISTIKPAYNANVVTPNAASVELEAMRKRETWMKAALALAVKRGFVAPDQLEMPDGSAAGVRSPDLTLDDVDVGVEGSDKGKVIRALVTLKTQLADARATIAVQAEKEADRIGELDRARSAALQEAAFLRAKLAAIEADSPGELSRLERERTTQLERQLSDSIRDAAELDRQSSRLREELHLEQQLRASAEERLTETAKRAMAAEGAQMRAYDELAALQKRTYQHDSMLREAKERVSMLTSLVTRHQAEHQAARSQLDDANAAAERHANALGEVQVALTAATARASEHERLHHEHRHLVQQHEATINQLRAEVMAKTSESESRAARLAELEVLAARHRDEADAHRKAAAGSLAQVLEFHRQRQTTRGGGAGEVPEHASNRLRALEEEAEQLRQLSSQARGAADSTASELQEMRERNIGLEKEHSGLRSELSAMRSQLAIALQEVARLKEQTSAKEVELRERTRGVEAAQVKTSLLRQFMSDRGVAVPGDEELSARAGYADKRILRLEDELESRTRDLQAAEARVRESSARIEALQREVSSSSGGVGGGGVDAEAAERRAAAAERELAETTASYKERMAQLENDYNTAVQFVKGTERMLRRMKDELTKYKTENAQLQSDVASLRSGGQAGDDVGGGAGGAAARDIEALRTRLVDMTKQGEEMAAENRELERRLATLISEQKEHHDRSKGLVEGHAEAARRQTELEAEVERLESNLYAVRRELQETLALNQHLSSELSQASKGGANGGGGGGGGGVATIARDLNASQMANEQLRSENSALAQKLQEVEDKFQLLLGRMETSHGATGDEPVRSSQAFSITSELDKWERAGAGIP